MSDQYKKDITAVYCHIKPNERLELFNRMKSGDISAKEKILNSCFPLVVHIANHFYPNNKHIDLDDFIQEGNIALLKAIEKWDISKGWITTVATKCICNAFNDLIVSANYKMKRPYRIPKSTMAKAKKRGIVLDNSKRVGEKICFKIEKNIEEQPNSNCIADVINMLDMVDSNDKNIFLTWMRYINKNNRFDLTAKDCGLSIEDVKFSIKRTKKFLRKAISSGV
jgi:RNA polymerase sigma factor (sigma-70 family)